MLENEVLCNSSSFSWDTFWTAISAIFTFFACVVALYLGNSFRHVKITLTGSKIDNDTFNEKNEGEKRFQKIVLYNASLRKVRLQDYGYMIGKNQYKPKHYRVRYSLIPHLIEERKNNEGKTTGTHIRDTANAYYLPYYILDGEDCIFGLFPGDYRFSETNINKKLYVFVKVNEKIYKYCTGLTLKKFHEIIKNINEKSPEDHD